jgi:TldD protein
MKDLTIERLPIGRFILCLSVIVCGLFSSLLFAQEQPSPVLQAMQDELARSTKLLKLEKEKPPYYVAYRIDDVENITITGRFGAIIEDATNHDRTLYTNLRVGSYDFDNSNFVAMPSYDYSFGGTMENIARLPLEDDYPAIRQKIWLATDAAYKEAFDVLSKKKSAIEHKEITEKIPDFSKSNPYVKIEELQELKIDHDTWRKNIEEISNLFRQYPKIQTSRVVFFAKRITRYFIDSEGNKQVTNSFLTFIEAYANTQNKAGANLRDYVGFYVQTPDELPQISAIIERVKAMADTLSIYTDVPEEKEYTGPVLFTGDATGQLFYDLLGKGVSDARKPLYEQEQMGEMLEDKTGFFAGKLDKSILPDYFSVDDDPTINNSNNSPLIGGYSIDDQGVKAQKIQLVKDGKLVTLPMSRRPLKEIKLSNGHGRYFNGMVRSYISNLIVESNKNTDDLQQELITLCKDNDLDYGIVITQLNPALPKTADEMAEEIYSYFGGGKAEAPMLDAPFIAYKLYKDGKKELIKGLNFEGITPSVLKDIVAAGKGQKVYNVLIKERFGGGAYLPVSIVAPSVIVGKMVLTSQEEKPKKRPFLAHPFFGK